MENSLGKGWLAMNRHNDDAIGRGVGPLEGWDLLTGTEHRDRRAPHPSRRDTCC